jgi:hypothetical protein
MLFEDGRSRFLRNVDTYPLDYAVVQPRRPSCENQESIANDQHLSKILYMGTRKKKYVICHLRQEPRMSYGVKVRVMEGKCDFT